MVKVQGTLASTREMGHFHPTLTLEQLSIIAEQAEGKSIYPNFDKKRGEVGTILSAEVQGNEVWFMAEIRPEFIGGFLAPAVRVRDDAGESIFQFLCGGVTQHPADESLAPIVKIKESFATLC